MDLFKEKTKKKTKPNCVSLEKRESQEEENNSN